MLDSKLTVHAVLTASILLLSMFAAGAQQRRFEIGAANIYGNMRYNVPNASWGSWAGDTAARGSQDATAIPTERWEQLQDLGLSMAHFTIFPERLVEGPDNVALKLNHAAWVRGMTLSLSDPVLWDLSRSERRLYHPESGQDFAVRDGAEAVFSAVLHAGVRGEDRHNTQQAGSNALLFRQGRDEGARADDCLRGDEVFTDIRMQNSSGFYVLSVRCAVSPDALPADDREVCSITLSSAEGAERYACTSGMLRAAVALHPMGSSAGLMDTVAVEVLLGRFHLTGLDGNDGAGIRIERRDAPGPDPGFNQRTRAAERLRLALQYHGGTDIAIDAVALSDERAFALCNSGHPSVKAGEENLVARIRDRIRLLGADSSAQWPALRYLEFSESLAEDGSDVPARALAGMLQEAAGSRREAVLPFVWASGAATKDSGRINRGVASMRGLVPGHYVYPFEESYGVRPQDEAYYDSTYFPVSYERGGGHTWTNFRSLADWYRQYAEARHTYAIDAWIPAIQTHSWLFRSGWPVSPIADTIWLYEPNAAEFRFQCNLALCYGATGLMLYQFSSWPGKARKENVTDRDDTEYGGMGSVGLLDPHDNQPRRLDTNGEDKWDSTRNFLRSILRPHADMLSRLTWKRGYDCHTSDPSVRSTALRSVQSWAFQPGGFMSEDSSARCFVEVGEFSDEQGALWLFVVNKRVDVAGSRMINLQLKSDLAADTRALELHPVSTSHVSLETYVPGNYVLSLPPGDAALLRLR